MILTFFKRDCLRHELAAFVFCAAFAAGLCFRAAPVRAEEMDYYQASLDGLNYLMDNVSGLSDVSDNILIVAGHNSTSYSIRIYGSGYNIFASINYSVSTPVWSYLGRSATVTVQPSYVGETAYSSYRWYYDWPGSGGYQLDYLVTNDVDQYNAYYSYYTASSSTWNIQAAFTSSSDFSGIVSDFETEFAAADPTEAVTDSSGAFQLPEEWINGGQTLDTEEYTTPSDFDFSGVDDVFESYAQLDIDSGTENAIGFFWAFVERIISALDFWNYVFFALMIGLVCYLLGR